MKRPGPFTVAWLRETIEGLGPKYSVPSEPKLGLLARWLNVGAEIYADQEPGRAARARATEMYNALQVQKRWFDDRRKELEAANIAPEMVERETQLRDKFNSYLEAMTSHMEAMTSREPPWLVFGRLPMDVWLVSPPLKSWRDIVAFVADAFVLAMEESNPDKPFGASDHGPTVRFAVAALDLIGALPRARIRESLYPRVAKHLRAIRAKKRKKQNQVGRLPAAGLRESN